MSATRRIDEPLCPLCVQHSTAGCVAAPRRSRKLGCALLRTRQRIGVATPRAPRRPRSPRLDTPLCMRCLDDLPAGADAPARSRRLRRDGAPQQRRARRRKARKLFAQPRSAPPLQVRTCLHAHSPPRRRRATHSSARGTSRARARHVRPTSAQQPAAARRCPCARMPHGSASAPRPPTRKPHSGGATARTCVCSTRWCNHTVFLLFATLILPTLRALRNAARLTLLAPELPRPSCLR